ncbi:MAG: lysophospholipid acyltransferase family protein [Oscillospiraceae bacterium]|jgi:1-acyl-sn-glycerol-3-phosphate acyltransferase
MAISAKDRKRHLWIVKFARRYLVPVIFKRIGFEMKAIDADIPKPYIVLSNHTTDYDPIMLEASLPDQMYFVASEHVFRKGFLSKLLVTFFDPIQRKKGVTEAGTVLEMARRARAGYNLGIFPEGNKSFDGESLHLHPTIGKLLKKLKINVVTMRIKGGYLTAPRWGHGIRKGKMWAELVNVYTVDEIEKMTSDELIHKIADDIYVDAYTVEEAEKIRYRGKNKAHYLETALWICPKCGKIGKLHSKGNFIECDCGFRTEYDEYGRFSDGPFENVKQWYRWQMDRYYEMIDEGTVEMPDDNVTVVEVQESKLIPVAKGSFRVGRHQVRLKGKDDTVRTFDDVHSLGLIGRNKLVFESGKNYYEVKCTERFCALKYVKMFDRLSSETV